MKRIKWGMRERGQMCEILLVVPAIEVVDGSVGEDEKTSKLQVGWKTRTLTPS